MKAATIIVGVLAGSLSIYCFATDRMLLGVINIVVAAINAHLYHKLNKIFP